jgi:hypothetical protein
MTNPQAGGPPFVSCPQLLIQYIRSYPPNLEAISSIIWMGDVARMGEKRSAYRILVGKLEGKRPLGRSRRRLEDNIRMDLRDIGWGVMDWIELAQYRDQWRALVNTVMNLWVP